MKPPVHRPKCTGGALREPTKRLILTQKIIEKLPIPKSGRSNLYDEKVRDLGLRVESITGRKSFFWRRKIQGRPVFKAIGVFPSTSVNQARGHAHKLSGDLDVLKRNNFEGKNPFERPRGELTLAQLLEDYIDRQLRAKAKRPEIAEANARWMFSKYLAGWRQQKLNMVRRKDVVDLHGEIGKKYGHHTANRIIQLLRAMFYFAEDAELSSTANPARKIKLFYEGKRKRFVQEAEMPKLFAALKTETNPDVVDYVCLCLWTGARRSDILSARWQDISFPDHKWDIPDPKGDPYTAALAPEVITILKTRLSQRTNDNPWVFPSLTSECGHLVDLKGRWKALLQRAGIENLRQHDLRRTYASWQAKQGTSLQVVSKSLGHSSTAATEIYSRLDLRPIRQSVTTAVTAMVKASKKNVKQL